MCDFTNHSRPPQRTQSNESDIARRVYVPLEAGEVSWKEPAAYLPKSRKAFCPQSKALGLGVDEELSPSVMRKTVHWGAKLGSFW